MSRADFSIRQNLPCFEDWFQNRFEDWFEEKDTRHMGSKLFRILTEHERLQPISCPRMSKPESRWDGELSGHPKLWNFLGCFPVKVSHSRRFPPPSFLLVNCVYHPRSHTKVCPAVIIPGQCSRQRWASRRKKLVCFSSPPPDFSQAACRAASPASRLRLGGLYPTPSPETVG